MKKALSYFLYSAWLWAVLPTLLISFFIEDIGHQYSIANESKSSEKLVQEVFADLNGDGITEQIHAKPGPPLVNVPIMDNEGKYFDQWNLPDDLNPEISSLYFGNFDQDTFGEIYIFTTKQDSIFLNVNEFFDPNGLHLERIFITKVNLVEGMINSNLKQIGFYDQNRDGKQEFYFRITTGFGLWPRLCYFYDLENEILKSSPFTGINFNEPVLTDIDGDLRPDIISPMSAAGNYDTPTPYTDYSAWLMVLNDQLEFKFPPIEFTGFGGALDVFTIDKNSEQKLLAVYNYHGTDISNHTPSLLLFTPQGKLIKEKALADLGITTRVKPIVLHPLEQDLIILLAGSAYILDSSLELIEKRIIPLQAGYYSYIYDLNNDGNEELLLHSKNDRKLIAYNAGMVELGTVPFDAEDYEWQVSNQVTKTGESKLFIKSGTAVHYLQLKENKYYLLEYLVYPAIYLGFVLFIGLVKTETTKQIEKRENQKRKLQTLQLQSIKGQLDPHFTFNALNSVASLLYLEDRNAAYDYLNKFTRLLRQLLSDAERVYRTLEEELVFVTAYLNLEKLRFGEKFSYEIHLGEGITQKENVPVMVLQTFAENAIRHGLMPRTNGGKLSIHIEKEDDYLKLTIEDNGVGRTKAAENTKRQGKGLKMIHEFYEILNQFNTKPIRHSITDLFQDGNPAGTRVDVWVPLYLVDDKFKVDK